MLLMALNVRRTADMTKRSPGQGGHLSSVVVRPCLAFRAKQNWTQSRLVVDISFSISSILKEPRHTLKCHSSLYMGCVLMSWPGCRETSCSVSPDFMEHGRGLACGDRAQCAWRL